MANPFLMGDLDIGGPQISSNNGSFNPFLSGTMDFATSDIENPFTSAMNNGSSTNTNPFAFSGADASQTSSNFFSSITPEVDKNSQSSTQMFENIFQTPSNNITTNGASDDFFGGFIESSQSQPSSVVQTSARSSIDQTHSLMDNNSDFFGTDQLGITPSREGSGTNTPKGAPPKRPPPPGVPPRPGFPPSKETKDLILSVTGAMEATSSHLLDRLQANRTPSPTPIRDLNSPSPTPDVFGDLLGVDDINQESLQQPVQEFNLLGDMGDDIMPIATYEESTHIIPIAPVPSSVPQVIPVAPTAQITSVPAVSSAPPPRPLPPRPPERPKTSPAYTSAQENIIDFSEPPKRPPPPRQEGPSKLHDTVDNLNTNIASLQSSRPSEPELDFTAMSQAAVTISNVHLEDSSDLTKTVFENNTSASFSSVFDTQIATSVEPKLDLGVTHEVTEMSNTVPDPNMSRSVFEDNQQAFPTSPFDQTTNDIEDTSFSAGFVSEMITSVMEVSPSVTDNSMFSVNSLQTNDLFYNNTDTSMFPPQTSDLFPPTETILHTTPVIPSEPFNIFRDSDTSGPKSDDFDAFTAKFESAGFSDVKNSTLSSDPFDPFSSSPFGAASTEGDSTMGFGADDNFDTFLAVHEPPPVPQSTPARIGRGESADSDDNENDFNVFIKPKQAAEVGGALPSLAPPPKSPISNAFQDTSPRFNPFDKSQEIPAQVTENFFAQADLPGEGDKPLERTDSQETPPTPLFDEDVSQPLEAFPRIDYEGPGWEMQLRQPNKKKITGQRYFSDGVGTLTPNNISVLTKS